jgi:predicted Zn-dependent protease
MSPQRLLFFAIVMISGIALSWLLYLAEISTPFEATLAPAFQLLGRPVKAVDRALTRVLPIDGVDEAAFGDAIARRYEPHSGGSVEQQLYAQRLLSEVSELGRKGFSYRVYLIETEEPNAFALPGGIVVITTGLLSTLKSESELAAVLAHEVGHVELSHCLDRVRFEILSRKIGSASLGELADLAMTLMLRHTFSKTQEEEADEYAWAYLRQSDYDPWALGLAFHRLLEGHGETGHERSALNPVLEYLQTHPHLELREERYRERAKVWRENHPSDQRYVGRSNLLSLTPMSIDDSDSSEWKTD